MIPKQATEVGLPASSPALYLSGTTAIVMAITAPKRIAGSGSRNCSDDGKEFLWAVTIVVPSPGLKLVIFTLVRVKKRKTRTIELYSERSITSEGDLLDFIEALDEDEGIRVEGNLQNHIGGGFIFVGYYRGSYCVNICDRVWSRQLKKHVAGEKDEYYYFDKGRQAYDFVMKEARIPIRAWLY